LGDITERDARDITGVAPEVPYGPAQALIAGMAPLCSVCPCAGKYHVTNKYAGALLQVPRSYATTVAVSGVPSATV
jgi:hypothetical protein